MPEHNWKFSAADVREREHWDEYQHAFSKMLSATSTRWAPWYVIPADRKWFARICAGAVLAHTLIDIDPRYPTVSAEERRALGAVARRLESEAPEGAPADPYAMSVASAETGHGKLKKAQKGKRVGKTEKAGTRRRFRSETERHERAQRG